MPKKTIEQVDVTGRRVLMRVDFNVPVDEQSRITDDRRIRLSLPSIRSVIDRDGKLILMSHFGRPEGKGIEPSESLKPAADRLRELLGSGAKAVHFPGDSCVGEKSAVTVKSLRDGEIVVLENLRFEPGEKKGDPAFAAKLAAYGDIYCNEAFGVSHREDASMVAVPKAMAGKPKVTGLLLQKELKYLTETIAHARHPFIAVLGGAKVSDKIGPIRHLTGKVDIVLVGGAMAYTFLKARGREVGNSLVQAGMLNEAQEILEAAAASKTKLMLPVDHVCGKQITSMTPVEVHRESIPPGWMGLDIGPQTTAQYVKTLRTARTVVWNGPMGAFETKPFDVGTRQVAQAMAKATADGAISVAGGGDTAAAVDTFGLEDKFSHVSTGGGASLELLAGKTFKSIALLNEL